MIFLCERYMDPMSGCKISLVFTLPPRDSTLQFKRCAHLCNKNARQVISEVCASFVLQCTVRKKPLKSAKSLQKTNIKCSLFLRTFSSLETLQMINWLCLLWEIYVIYMIDWFCLLWNIFSLDLPRVVNAPLENNICGILVLRC